MERSCNKQDEEKSGGKLGGQTGTSGTKQQLTVIAIHKMECDIESKQFTLSDLIFMDLKLHFS